MASFQRIAGALEEFRLVNDGELCARCREPLLDLRLGKLWPEIGALHAIECAVQSGAAWTKMLVIGGECGADRAAGITRRRLNPDALEGTIAQNLAIGDAIERDATSKAEIFNLVCLRKVARHAQHDFFGDLLHGRGKVHVALGERGLGIARRPTEKVVELPRRHREPGRIVEIALVQPEGAVLLEVDDVVEDQVGVGGLEP